MAIFSFYWQSSKVGVFLDVPQRLWRDGTYGREGGCAVCIGKHWSGGGSRILGEEN